MNATRSMFRSRRARFSAKRRAPRRASYCVKAKKPQRSAIVARMKRRYTMALARREACEAAHLDAFAELLRRFTEQVLYGRAAVFDIGLFQQILRTLRVHGRDLHRELAGERAELRILRDEVGLA